MDIQGAQRGNNHEVGQDERPAAGPGAPESASQIRDEDPYLDGQRSRKGLADGDPFTKLVLCYPPPLFDQFFFHLSAQGNRSPKPKRAQAQVIADEVSDPNATSGVAFHASVTSRFDP